MTGFEAAQLAGPLGGMLALAYAAGAASGWAFATITVLRITKEQISDLKSSAERERAECDRRVSALETRVREVEDRYTTGMERQLLQTRESAVHLMDRGVIRKLPDTE